MSMSIHSGTTTMSTRNAAQRKRNKVLYDSIKTHYVDDCPPIAVWGAVLANRLHPDSPEFELARELLRVGNLDDCEPYYRALEAAPDNDILNETLIRQRTASLEAVLDKISKQQQRATVAVPLPLPGYAPAPAPAPGTATDSPVYEPTSPAYSPNSPADSPYRT